MQIGDILLIRMSPIYWRRIRDPPLGQCNGGVSKRTRCNLCGSYRAGHSCPALTQEYEQLVTHNQNEAAREGAAREGARGAQWPKSVAKCHSFAAQERGKRKCLLAGIGDDEEDEGEPSEGAKRLASVKNVQNAIISETMDTTTLLRSVWRVMPFRLRSVLSSRFGLRGLKPLHTIHVQLQMRIVLRGVI